MNKFLTYDPGALPTREAPVPGEEIFVQLAGLPPAKKRGASLRNPTHPRYEAFVALRNAAARAMEGRGWYFGPIGLNLVVYDDVSIDWFGLNEYLGGVMDSLDGSSGQRFTYLPVVYEDDCQVTDTRVAFKTAKKPSYDLTVTFL